MSQQLESLTIVIATLNSELTLEKTLKSIRSQNYPQELIEILVIDGGSTDRTRELADKYSCDIVENPRVEPATAKRIGFCRAKGRYLAYVDSDEELENLNSLKNKIRLMQENDVCSVMSTGYKTPDSAAPVNYYLNEFGDPFSFFIYRQSLDYRFFINSLKRFYPVVKDSETGIIFEFDLKKKLPLIELGVFCNIIDMKYLRQKYAITTENELDPYLLPHLFYIMLEKIPRIAIAKEDFLIHHSSVSLLAYQRKISWRIRNNTHHRGDVTGQAGFLAREKYDQESSKLKKYLFLPYNFLIFPVAFDTIFLIVSRKSIHYWIHFYLSLFTAVQIIYHMSRKILRCPPQMTGYGTNKVISQEELK